MRPVGWSCAAVAAVKCSDLVAQPRGLHCRRLLVDSPGHWLTVILCAAPVPSDPVRTGPRSTARALRVGLGMNGDRRYGYYFHVL
jgi:hypothetical protein